MKRTSKSSIFLVDARCLQDNGYRTRGVGRHALNLLQNARSSLPKDCAIIAFTDPLAECLWPEHAKLFDDVTSTAYAAKSNRPDFFVQLSPMTHSPMPVANILGRAQVTKATAVYDFIPDKEPERYFPSPESRIHYELARLWLQKYDLFFPISEATKHDLLPYVGPRGKVVVTGAPVDERFEAKNTSAIAAKTHVLTVGGGDPRKNVECVVRAHASSAFLNEKSIPLVVTGRYDAYAQAQLCELHQANGGRPDLIHLRSEVDDDVLVELYRSAYCVVVPSLAEGFSLPVVEAMASQTPVVASHIPAHSELLGEHGHLHDPSDWRGFAASIEAMCLDERQRIDALKSQDRRWLRFRGAEVASVFWSTVMQAGTRVSSPKIHQNVRPKLAFLSPFPPDFSGVADYSAASLAEIGRLFEVHAYTETNKPVPLSGVTATLPLTDFPFVTSAYDQVVGVVGNSNFHRGIFERLLDYGGACIEHDNRLLGFYCDVLGHDRALSQAERELGREVGSKELYSWLADESLLQTDFLGELVQACKPMFFHSAVTVEMVERRYGVQPKLLPFSIYRPWSDDCLTSAARSSARVELEILESDVLIASFGLGAQTKGLRECIWVLEILRNWGLSAKLAFVGGVEENEFRRIRSLCSELGLVDHIRFVGGSGMAFVDEELYRKYLQAADVGIQLRTFGLGGLSGALLDCIAAGLPTVATNDLAVGMDAPSYVARVPDKLSPVLISEAVLSLLSASEQNPRNLEERKSFYAGHNFRVYAEEFAEGIGLDVRPISPT